MCEYASKGLICAWQSTCEHAHSAQELRVQAAIDLGKLPEDFKTRLCEHASRPGTVSCSSSTAHVYMAGMKIDNRCVS